MPSSVTEFREFFETIYGNCIGYVDIVNRDPENYKSVSSEMWRFVSENLDYIAKYCSLRHDEDTYCSVAVFSGEHRTNEDTRAITKVVWADADTCNPKNFRAQPSIVVQTSPERWHCWWVLETPVPASEAARVSQKIAMAHRDQGCDLGWFASKILRVPGTTNLKDPENPYLVTATYTGEVYTLDQLGALYEDVLPTAAPVTELSEEMPELLSLSERIDLEQRVIKNSPYENLYTTKPDGDWSKKLFRLEFDLFREGCTPREVFTLAKYAACNKFERDNKPDSELWKDVRRAYRQFVAETEGAASTIVERKKAWTVPPFLTDGERKLLPDTFVERYVKWVADRTDASPTYQRSLAYLILSCVFGNRGYLPDPYGRKFLNLWILLLGESTRTRKSTTKDIALDIIHGFELNALGGERIDIGSDVTKEGLGKVLGQRDGQVSLVQTDEVSGMFREFYGKNYQIGTISYFTDLYGGRVPVVLRAGKDAGQPERVTTVFNFLGVGIREEVAETLTRNDFKSGFLPRALWAVADPLPRVVGSDDWPEDVVKNDDPGFAKWIQELRRRSSLFTASSPAAISIDNRAKARYNMWAETLRQHAESFKDPALEASVERFEHSVRKAAALLAMYDGVTVIQLKHLLPALAQAELWYGDLLRMLSEVSASAFERLQNEVEAFVAQGQGGIRAIAAVSRKFSSLRPQELNEVTQSLLQQGRVRKNGDTQLQVLA